MINKDSAVDAYIAELDEPRKKAMHLLRNVITESLPAGFEEQMQSMPSYVVPLAAYPTGYHVAKNTPLPFISIASQKNFIALYHFGIYVDEKLMEWFRAEYPRHMTTKLDMGKSCIRFKKPEQMPLQLIAELCAKRDASQWIASYEQARNR